VIPIRLFDPDREASEPSQEITVKDVIDLYLRHAATMRKHCPEARADRERTLGLFSADWGQLAVRDAKPFHLSDWIESRPGWKSVSTRRAKANEIRAAFAWAADGERIDRNPFKSVRYAEAERRPEMPDATLDTICSLANKQFERAARFLRLTGCRLSEMCRAVWRDVDLVRAVWVIPNHKSVAFTGRPKTVALVPEAVNLLLELRTLAFPAAKNAVGTLAVSANAFIFLNTRGKQWNRRTLGQHLRRMKKVHGIDCKATLHGARHRAISAAIIAGGDITLIAQQAGHSTPAITSRYYAHLDTDEALNAIRDAFGKGIPK
jgi:integrase